MICRKELIPAFDLSNPAGHPFDYTFRAARQAHPVNLFHTKSGDTHAYRRIRYEFYA